jgi:hypothetical protein
MVFILNGGYIIILQVRKDIFPLLSVNQPTHAYIRADNAGFAVLLLLYAPR